jgi:hypothetical protein
VSPNLQLIKPFLINHQSSAAPRPFLASQPLDIDRGVQLYRLAMLIGSAPFDRTLQQLLEALLQVIAIHCAHCVKLTAKLLLQLLNLLSVTFQRFGQFFPCEEVALVS